MESTTCEQRDGMLGVRSLHGLWLRWNRRASARRSAGDWTRDCVVIHGLGVGIEQTARFLSVERSFEEFEAWIVGLNGGTLERERIDRINAALSGEAYAAQTRQRHAEIETMPAVLDATDLADWQEHGYVVLREAIPPDACAATVEAICRHIDIDAGDPSTWPARRHCQGIMVQLFQHAALEVARRSSRIHKACAQLWGHADLIATNDRCGFNPPENAAFRFPGPHLHWDAEPTPPIGFGVQGILYLTDTGPDQGAFCCVPGFHREFDEWLRALPAGCNPYDRIPHEAAIPIPGHAGDMVLWHHGLPHGSSPNRTARPRFVQYLTMFPARIGASSARSAT
ncbi:phytanoyl-CoA dioxygenase family protein [Rudaea sp.]|uniref:phytanoyl-CoA dioxygenase family protein n=1 Tax=Rudaea sp. TaxID=2136325 RepID=UPI0032203751